ncbi:MAG: Hpt domain-containing protein [Vicinamibacterales bacterium]
MTPTEPVLDPASLETLRALNQEGEPDVVIEVLQLFLDDAPARVDTITAAALAGDAVTLARAAHGLKGSAANIGAARLRATCRAIEEAGREGRLAEARTTAAALPAEFADLRQAIAGILAAG